MILVPLLFALLFAAALVWPVTDLVQLPQFYAATGIADHTPWSLLVVAVALPVLLYVAAFLLGRGRPAFERTLIFVVALATSFVLYFGVAALVSALRPLL